MERVWGWSLDSVSQPIWTQMTSKKGGYRQIQGRMGGWRWSTHRWLDLQHTKLYVQEEWFDPPIPPSAKTSIASPEHVKTPKEFQPFFYHFQVSPTHSITGVDLKSTTSVETFDAKIYIHYNRVDMEHGKITRKCWWKDFSSQTNGFTFGYPKVFEQFMLRLARLTSPRLLNDPALLGR